MILAAGNPGAIAREVAAHVHTGCTAIALTGAGASAESGVAPFRAPGVTGLMWSGLALLGYLIAEGYHIEARRRKSNIHFMQEEGALPTHATCEYYDEAAQKVARISRPISPAHFYTMNELQVTGYPLLRGAVEWAACSVGDILYMQHSGSNVATKCVVVTRTTPTQVHTAEVRGAAQYRMEEQEDMFVPWDGKSRPPTWVLVLEWFPDPAQLTGERHVFRWSAKSKHYANRNHLLVRCYGFPRR